IQRLPEVIRIRDVITDPERRIDATINEGLRAAKPGSSWIEDESDGTARLRADITALVAKIASQANELLPPFVRDLGSLAIGIERMSSWTDDAPRSVVRWRFSDREGESHFNMLGAGTRRWIAASLEAACEDILRVTVGRPNPLYLIDEPEMHLHPLSQTEVLRWIEDRVAEGATAVLTTHSPLILATERESSRLIGLVRHGSHVGQVDISDDLLDEIGSIDGLADAIGTDRVAALQLTRGILVVEGEHDRKVIKKFFGPELARARIRLLPIRGTKNTMALADSELFASLGLRLCVMFDEVSDTVLASGDIAVAGSAEEKKMLELLNAVEKLRRPGQEVKAVAFDLPDVMCALPLDGIRRAFPQVTLGIDWPEIIKRWRSLSNPKGGFKQYALKQLGLDGIHPDAFVDGTLRAVEESDPSLAGSSRKCW
ncbi:MAG: AAA family ATPase, partial [Actinobacteria bacterium]|nr:AAA family ATPase [Actinomycetota bacterium]